MEYDPKDPAQAWRFKRHDLDKVEDTEDRQLLEELRVDLDAQEQRPSELLVSIRLSQILGTMRPVKFSHGCEIPLNFDGVPAKTVFGQQEHWKFEFAAPLQRDHQATVVNKGRL